MDGKTVVNGNVTKKDRRRRAPGAKKKMEQETGTAAENSDGGQGAELEEGMSPNLQAHIGRHVRAVFDEVAREPIPEHLLRLLKDLDRRGDK
ncbi:MAG: NepR family anti-sigma factor [Methyloceanibacter sp.]